MIGGVKANKCMPAEAMIQQEMVQLSARWNGRHEALGGELGSRRVLLLRHLVAVPTVSCMDKNFPTLYGKEKCKINSWRPNGMPTIIAAI